jgi:hypothetical protein
MHFYRVIALVAISLVLTSCDYLDTLDYSGPNEAQKRVDAEQRCQTMGYILPDNEQYDNCVRSELQWEAQNALLN